MSLTQDVFELRDTGKKKKNKKLRHIYFDLPLFKKMTARFLSYFMTDLFLYFILFVHQTAWTVMGILIMMSLPSCLPEWSLDYQNIFLNEGNLFSSPKVVAFTTCSQRAHTVCAVKKRRELEKTMNS